MTHENHMKLKIQCPLIKFYWHTAMPSPSPVICGNASHKAGLSTFDEIQVARKAKTIYSLALYRKKFAHH